MKKMTFSRMKKIMFSRTISGGYLGRHGGGKISGLEIMKTGDTASAIMFSPINSKGHVVVSSFIEIPTEEVDNLIAVLIKLRDEK